MSTKKKFLTALLALSMAGVANAQVTVDGPLRVKGINLGLTVLQQHIANNTPIILHEGLNQWTMLPNGAIVLKDNPKYGLTVLYQNIANDAEIILHEGCNQWTILDNGAVVLKDNPKYGLTVQYQNKVNNAKIILHEGYNQWERGQLPQVEKTGYVRVFCEAGYVTKFTISYLDGSGNRQWDGATLSTGLTKQFEIPANATDVRIDGHMLGITGEVSGDPILSQAFPKAPNACFKTYGTIFNPEWNQNCD